MKMVTYLLVIAFLTPESLLQAEVQLTTNSESIQCGQSAKLGWKVNNVDRVFITSIGRVKTEGSQEISPRQTTTYTLIAEGSSTLISKSITLGVNGCSRGDNEFPNNFDRYQNPITVKLPTASLVDFLSHIHRILQDEMMFSVKGLQNPNEHLVFITKPMQQGELLQPDDRRIGARRISFLVKIDDWDSKSKVVTYTIRTLIEYRKRIESTWRLESGEDIYRREANKLRQKMEVSSLLCKRPSLQSPSVYRIGIRPSKMMLNWLSAAFQSLIGIVHF